MRRILAGLFILATCVAANNRSTFSISFGRGYNMRDYPEMMESGYFTHDSYNFDPRPDGAAVKRCGITVDKLSIAGADTSVDAIIYDPIDRIYGGVGTFTYVIAGNRWWQRFNADVGNFSGGAKSEGDYVEFTSKLPAPINTELPADLQWIVYNDRPMVYGDISAITQISGDPSDTADVSRAILPGVTKWHLTTPTTSAGGSLAASTTYYYCYAYMSPYADATGGGEVGYASDYMSVTTDETNKKVTLTLKPYPPYLTGGNDSLKSASGINIYRGTTPSAMGYLTTVDNSASTWVDSGQYTPDRTSLAPLSRTAITTGRYPVEYNDFLFFVGPRTSQITGLDVGTSLTLVNAGFETGDLTGWTTTGSPTIATVDNSDSYAGTYSYNHSASSANDGLQQSITIQPNTTYTLACYIKCSQTSGSPYGFRVQAYTDPGYEIMWATANDTWTYHTKTFTTGSDPVSAMLFVGGDGIGRVDALTLSRISGGATTSDTLLFVTPYTLTDSVYAKAYVRGGWTATDNSGAGTATVTSSDAEFIYSDVRPGDYFVSRAGAHRIQSIVSDSQIVVQNTGYTSDDKAKAATAGGNLYRIDNEIVGLAYHKDANYWRVVRGLMGTSAASHSAAAPLYTVHDGAGDNIYHSEVYNPHRLGYFDGYYDNPIRIGTGSGGRVMGLVESSGSLLVMKDRATFTLTGIEDGSFIVTALGGNVGSVSPKSIVPYSDGAITLDNKGLYWLSSTGVQQLGSILSSAIKDSAATNYYDDAAGVVYDSRYYLSVVDDATNKTCRTYVYDIQNQTHTVYTGWSPRVWGVWPSESDNKSALYFGDWRKGNVYKVSESATSDVDTAGATVDIEAQLMTPAYSFHGADAHFLEAYMAFDSNDTLRVDATITQADTVFTTNCLNLSPTDGDTSYSSGHPRRWVVPINEMGHSCQLTIWTSGDGRCVVYPGTLVAREVQLK